MSQNKTLVDSIKSDLIIAAIQGETKFLGQMYGDILFKIRQMTVDYPCIPLELVDLRDKFDDLNFSFLSLIQEFSDVQLKLKQKNESKED